MAVTIPTEGYCDEDDVVGLTGKDYSATTAPTLVQLKEFITQKADMINGVLDAVGFVTPISAAAARSLNILKNLNMKGAAADAENAVPGIFEESDRARAWRLEYEAALVMLSRRRMTLPDVSDSNDTPVAVDDQNPAGSFDVDSSGNENDPAFGNDWQM
ncbi:MAG: hypothetical protein HOC74_10110 [Gemmatimonadetes bacterium]|jgi:hypothetical protein|nr:hypothetical protein [Gemmatimonadota bacterium]